MRISLINHTSGKLSDADVQDATRAINRQLHEDFDRFWSIGAELRLEGTRGRQPDKQDPLNMRGDAVLYLWDGTDVPGALGYHDQNHHGIPYGFVFTDLCEELGENWTVTLSHEALELAADPQVNLLVMGPHPVDRQRDVFHWYEMCDAVQAETYEIDGVEVSNFVLPLYFTGSEEVGSRNDFLGTQHDGAALRSFGLNPGGYVGFFDPQSGQHDTYAMEGDEHARKRLEIKMKAGEARRAVRYQRSVAREVSAAG